MAATAFARPSHVVLSSSPEPHPNVTPLPLTSQRRDPALTYLVVLSERTR